MKHNCPQFFAQYINKISSTCCNPLRYTCESENCFHLFTEDDEAENDKKEAKKTRMKTRDKRVSYVSF